MSKSRTICFCPRCERKFSASRQTCPDDGTPLMEYEMVEEAERDRLVGEVLDGRFEVLEALSEGGMGKVYRGIQQGIEREVAIKVLQADPSREDDTMVRRFLREARAISKLSDPNIVNFIDFGQDERHATLYLVMELIDGCELAELMKGSRLDPAFVVEVGMQVCSALTEPHHEGMVHRDLKPANLMLLPRLDGSLLVKLVDFGIANSMQDQTRLTKTGVACGTPHYMAPEQIEGTEQTPTIDIYGLGAIFHHMLSGEVVFEAETDVKILFKHLKEPPTDLGELAVAREIPDQMCDLVHRMLAKSPSRRPESVLEVREALEKIRREEGLESIRLDPECDPPGVFDPWVIEEVAGRTSEPDEPFPGEKTQVDPGIREHVSNGEPAPGATSGPRRAVDSPGDGPTQLDVSVGEAPMEASGEPPGVAERLVGFLPGGEQFDLNLALSVIAVTALLAGVAIWQFGVSGSRQHRPGPIEIEPEGDEPAPGGKVGGVSDDSKSVESAEMVIGEPASSEEKSPEKTDPAEKQAAESEPAGETADEGSSSSGEPDESGGTGESVDAPSSGGRPAEPPAESGDEEESADEFDFKPVE